MNDTRVVQSQILRQPVRVSVHEILHCAAITCAYSSVMLAAAGVWLGVGVGVAVSLGVVTLTAAVLITIFKCKDLKM